MTYRVIVNGALGKMGGISMQALEADANCSAVIAANRDDDLAALIKQHQADIVVDFTLPECVFKNTQLILEENCRPVIGTSGLSMKQVNELQQIAKTRQLGGIIAPNFSKSAVLMMKYAADAAHYFQHSEIIEMHHRAKVDAPSGSAIKTAQLIGEVQQTQRKQQTQQKRQTENHQQTQQTEHPASTNSQQTSAAQAPAARGDLSHHNIPIHSLRQDGCFAEQQVIFSGAGEQLIISQRASSREAMMPGLLLACQYVMHAKELVYGLEHILSIEN